MTEPAKDVLDIECPWCVAEFQQDRAIILAGLPFECPECGGECTDRDVAE